MNYTNVFPGLPGYGLKGKIGEPGLNGLSIYMTDLNCKDDYVDVIKTISSQKSFNGNGKVEYNVGDFIVDIQGYVYEITNASTDFELCDIKYVEELNIESLFVKSNYVNNYDYSRIYPNKSIIDTYYTADETIEDFTTFTAYGTYVKNYGNFCYTNVLNKTTRFYNDLNPIYNFSSPDSNIALVQETIGLKDSTIFKFGNDSYDENLKVDFKNVYLYNNLYKNIDNKDSIVLYNDYIDIGVLKYFSPAKKDGISFYRDGISSTNIQAILEVNPAKFFTIPPEEVDLSNINVCVYIAYCATKYQSYASVVKSYIFKDNKWIIGNESYKPLGYNGDISIKSPTKIVIRNPQNSKNIYRVKNIYPVLYYKDYYSVKVYVEFTNSAGFKVKSCTYGLYL